MKVNFKKALQVMQSPCTVTLFLLISLLDGYSFAYVHVKGIVAFKQLKTHARCCHTYLYGVISKSVHKWKHRTAINKCLRIATLTLTLIRESWNVKMIKIFFVINVCVKLLQNRTINEGARAMTMLFFFSKKATVTLTLALEPSS